MTNEEIDYIISSLQEVVEHGKDWSEDYSYDLKKNEYFHHTASRERENQIDDWYEELS